MSQDRFLSEIEEIRPETLTFHRKCQLLVEKYIKLPIPWNREMALAYKLFDIENNFEFWYYFPINYKLNSLAFFMTEKGRSLVEKEQRIGKIDLANL